MQNLNKDHWRDKFYDIHNSDEENANNKVTKKEAAQIIDTALYSLISLLSDYREEEPDKKNVRARLAIVGFANFELKHVPDRMHRNPQTNGKVLKPAHNCVKVNVGKAFEEAINE